MRSWTDSEVKRLKKYYNKVTNEELQMLFPNKSFLAIYKKAYSLGLRKDKDISFINRSLGRRGNIKKSVTINAKGYKLIYLPEHRRADINGRVLEHIVVWEMANRMLLPDDCCVHHINGDKGDNRPENLCMMTKKDHTTFHNTGRKLSDESKNKIREKAVRRFKNIQNHPRHKNINILQMQQEIKNGETVKSVCEKYHIDRTTYYKKINKGDYSNAQ